MLNSTDQQPAIWPFFALLLGVPAIAALSGYFFASIFVGTGVGFSSAADVFIVQYHDQIDESVVEQMKRFAIANSVTENKQVYFGVIDGDDTNRLVAAYPKAFGIKD
jgi:hypothetical protein